MAASTGFLESLREQNRERRGLANAQRADLIQQYTTLRDQAQQVLTSGQRLDKASGNMRPLTDEEKRQLTETTTHLTNYIQRLYNPNVDVTSGQLQEDPIHKLTDKLRITRAPQGAPAGETAAEIAKSAGTFQTEFGETPATAGALSRQELERKVQNARTLMERYVPPGPARDQAINQLTERILGGGAPVRAQRPITLKGTVDGKPVEWLQDPETHETFDLSGEVVPKELTDKFVPQAAGSTPKVGSFGEFLLQAYGPNPTPEQTLEGRRKWAEAIAGTTVGSHFIQVPQPDGSVKVFEVQTTSRKEFPGAPTTPPAGGGKAQPTKPGKGGGGVGAGAGAGGGRIRSGQTVGGRLTAPQSKAQTEYDEAVKLDSIAKQVEKKPDDAINQKRLAVALERTSAGRFTTQALDYIIKAGWGNTIQQWAQAPTTGALPADIMRQLIDGAHENLQAAKEARDTAFEPPPSMNRGGGTETKSKGRRSLKAAMALPQNKGKSEQEVIEDLKKHGYEAVRP